MKDLQKELQEKVNQLMEEGNSLDFSLTLISSDPEESSELRQLACSTLTGGKF